MRATRLLSNIVRRKATTGITGLDPIKDPKPILASVYRETLDTLSAMPEGSVYRRATEALTKQRAAAVDSAADNAQIEAAVQAGLVEEIVKQAQDELALAKRMLLWRPWEELEDPAPAGQWERPLERK